jgi:galactokinase
MSDQEMKLDQMETAELAYHAEVSEFGEQGGMMDQFSSALGGVIHLRSEPKISCSRLSINLGEIILADSGEPKNTQGMLGSVRTRAEELISGFPSLDIHNSPLSYVGENVFLRGILRNRDITCDALNTTSPVALGNLLTEEHQILRDVLGTSTPRLNRMVDTAMNAGALGAKVNGSGGGGCMFAIAGPESASDISEALARESVRVWRVKVDAGVAIHE